MCVDSGSPNLQQLDRCAQVLTGHSPDPKIALGLKTGTSEKMEHELVYEDSLVWCVFFKVMHHSGPKKLSQVRLLWFNVIYCNFTDNHSWKEIKGGEAAINSTNVTVWTFGKICRCF